VRPLEAVIFDCDGVVIDSEPLIFEVTRGIFREHGIEIRFEDVVGGIGAGKKYVELPREKYGLTALPVEELLKLRKDRYLQLAEKKLKPVPGFFDLMADIKRRELKTALASASSYDWVLQSLHFAGVDPGFFDVIVNGDRIERKKPFPDLFLAAVRELEVDRSSCLVIEDAPTGVEAARRAGIRSVALVNSLPAELLSNADTLVRELLEIPGILNDLAGPPCGGGTTSV
jgi:beta-phosphoglucomutase